MDDEEPHTDRTTTSSRVKTFYVYLLSNSHRTLYLGVTSNLMRRLAKHRSLRWGGFTSRYKITKLVYFETTQCQSRDRSRETDQSVETEQEDCADSEREPWMD